VTPIARNFDAVLTGTAGRVPPPIDASLDLAALVEEVRGHVEACRYSLALEKIWSGVLDPANKYVEDKKPWSLVKTDKDAAREVVFSLAEPLRVATILLKPFLPRGAETIYRSFNFAKPWDQVRYADAAAPGRLTEDLRLVIELEGGKVKPLYPQIK